MTLSDRTALVLYGSETGNAQDMAEELGDMLQRLRFRTNVGELDNFDLGALLDHRVVVFVVSTTGQGDMPHNALAFWRKLLRKRLPAGCLDSLRFTCLGLGDTTYVKFNWAARKLIRRLEQLGASTFMDPCEADEQFPDGILGTFVNWAAELKSHVLEHHPLPVHLQPIPDDVSLPPRWSLEAALQKATTESDPRAISHRSRSSLPPPLSSPLPPDVFPLPDAWTAHMAENKRVTPNEHWQDVRLLTLDVHSRGPNPGDELTCKPGDCLTIYPKNQPDDVQRLIELMGWEGIADAPLDLTHCEKLPPGLRSPTSATTLRGLLLHKIDMTAVPRRSFLRAISFFATDADQRERLVEFTTAAFLDEYFDYATRARRTILETLADFSSVRVPAARLLDVFPLIRGRDFSIANGGAALAHPTDPRAARVELLVALVRYQTVLRRPRQGLCSRYLANQEAGITLIVGHKPAQSPVYGPINARRPLIAMATGTGIAPIRSLLHERQTHPSPGPALVFFGSRRRDADFHFGPEWAEALADGRLTALHAAFSRDGPDRVYVQHLVRAQAPALADFVPRRPIFALCGGSAKMAEACRAAVVEPFLAGAAAAAAADGEHDGDDNNMRNDVGVNSIGVGAGGNGANGGAGAGANGAGAGAGEIGTEEQRQRKGMLDAATWWQEIW